MADTEHGLRTLRRLSAERQLRLRRRQSAAIGLTVVRAVAMTLPPTRVYATRYIEACVTSSQFVLAKLQPNEKKSSSSRTERATALPIRRSWRIELVSHHQVLVGYVANRWRVFVTFLVEVFDITVDLLLASMKLPV